MTGITYKQNGTTLLGDLTYEYDKAGNRTKTGGSWARTGMPEPLSTTSYDANNRQLTFGDKTLAYDDNGNLQSITDSNGTTLYSWNARNQLVAINGPTVNASFVYDGVGRREAKTINGSLTEFLYDGLNPVQETSGAAILANLLPGLKIDDFLSRTDIVAGVTSSFLTDTLGSPVAVTDNNGAVQTEYIYESFGKTTATGAWNSSSYQYTGRENDGMGLYYYRARYFDPNLKRFTAEDPILHAGNPDIPFLERSMLRHPEELNAYPYVINNPMMFRDPTGLFPFAPGGNGNISPGFTEQDMVCTGWPVNVFDRWSCTKQCCVVHDSCYEKFRCNFSSWLYPAPVSCQRCNGRAVICMVRNVGKDNCREPLKCG